MTKSDFENAIEKENTRSVFVTGAAMASSWTIPLWAIASASQDIKIMSLFGALGYALGRNMSADKPMGSPKRQEAISSETIALEISHLLQAQGISKQRLVPTKAFELPENDIETMNRAGYVVVPLSSPTRSEKEKRIMLFRVAHQLATQRLNHPKVHSALRLVNDFVMAGAAVTGISYAVEGATLAPASWTAAQTALLLLGAASFYGVYRLQESVLGSISTNVTYRADKLASLYLDSAKPGLEFLSTDTRWSKEFDRYLQKQEDDLNNEQKPEWGVDKPLLRKEVSNAARAQSLARFHAKMVKEKLWRRITEPRRPEEAQEGERASSPKP
jgi:hypothetical protein